VIFQSGAAVLNLHDSGHHNHVCVSTHISAGYPDFLAEIRARQPSLCSALLARSRAHKYVTIRITCYLDIDTLSYPDDSSRFQRFFCSGTITPTAKTLPLQLKSHLDLKSETVADETVTDEENTIIRQMIKNHYAPFLMKRSSKILIGLIYSVYLGVSIYGCTILKNGLQPTKLMLDDSPVVTFYKLQENYFWDTGSQVQIAFSQAPDLAFRENRLKVQKVLEAFATSKHSFGLESIEFILDAFAEYMLNNGVFIDSMTRSDFYENLRFFLSFDENARFRNDIRWANETSRDNITAFRALVGLRNFSMAQDQIETVDDFRSIAAQYPNYG